MVGAKKKQALQADMEDFGKTFTDSEATFIRANLLAWYDHNHRVLPWRENPHSLLTLPEKKREKKKGVMLNCANNRRQERAYAVWISEVMLQQTRVAAVIDYFNRWTLKWPSLHHLAQATEEEVNSMWAGLGYYRRARYLLEGSRKIVQEYGGLFPQTADELQKIPGIGKYTAGAIASIAFEEVAPVVDGNVIRVLCRLRAISENPKTSTATKLFWELARQLVDSKRPGDWNQALMELGATLCTPTSPGCASCPISQHCKALALSQNKAEVCVTNFPCKVVKAIPREEFAAVCVLERIGSVSLTEGHFLLVKRPDRGLLAGLWEFPSAALSGSDTSLRAQKAAINKYLEATLKLNIASSNTCKMIAREEVGEYTHVFSHIRLHMFIEWLHIRVEEEPDDGTERNVVSMKWVPATALRDIGLTSGVKKVLDMLEDWKSKKLGCQAQNQKRKRSGVKT